MLLNSSLDTVWRSAFLDKPRPQLYTSGELNEDGYQTLTAPSDFLVDNAGTQKSAHLYAVAANNQEALVLAQQEWTALERLANRIKHHDASSVSQKEPQALPDTRTFEEHKEAILYGYKYEHKRKIMTNRGFGASDLSEQEKYDLREEPDPFAQGGFIPSDKQFKTLVATAKANGDELNPDKLDSYAQNFAYEQRPKGVWIPKMLPYVNDLPVQPKTRARTRQLNTYARSDATDTGRVYGEKGMNYQDSVDSASRAGTPFAGSPAVRKRKPESVASDALPRKKHPNQYTRHRENLETGAGAGAASVMSSRLQTIIVDAQAHASATSMSLEAPRKKHPNQHTKRREREEAERQRQRLTTLDGTYEQHAAPPPPPFASRSTSSPRPPVTFHVHRQPPVFRTPSNPPDFVNMTTAEKLVCQWDATSLVECVKHDHYWLHPDPEMADRWKTKILAGDYPVRTLAMLRKWDYWQKEGTNKRPRNTAAAVNAKMNDGNRRHKANSKAGERVSRRPRTVQPTAGVNGHVADTLQPVITNGHVEIEHGASPPNTHRLERDGQPRSMDHNRADEEKAASKHQSTNSPATFNGDKDRDTNGVNGVHGIRDEVHNHALPGLSSRRGEPIADGV